MDAIRVIANVDRDRRLVAQVPQTVQPGEVEIEIRPGPKLGVDDAQQAQEWTEAVAREWADDLADARQDIYTLSDGDPVP